METCGLTCLATARKTRQTWHSVVPLWYNRRPERFASRYAANSAKGGRKPVRQQRSISQP